MQESAAALAEIEQCVTMSGNLHNYEELTFTENGYYSKIPWSGTYATFDEPTLTAIKTMKSFSFKALGDDSRYNSYRIMSSFSR